MLMSDGKKTPTYKCTYTSLQIRKPAGQGAEGWAEISAPNNP